MNLAITVKVAWRALWANRLRTMLTLLGIIIGVASVIAMLAIGNGARIAVQKRIANMGVNAIHVFPGSRKRHGVRGGRGTGIHLKEADLKAVRDLPAVSMVCPMNSGRAQVVFGSANWNTTYRGTTPEFFVIRNWPVVKGRVFTDNEVRGGANVCVLGKITAEKLFGATDPVGQTIRIRHLPFKVIGVLTEKGDSGWGSAKDDTLIMPYTTAQRKLLGIDYIQYFTVSAKRADQVEELEKQVVSVLKELHHIPPDNKDAFGAYNQAEVSRTADESMKVFEMLLGGIASVSLLVGGIGIMNIMLVSVTERTKEIGIRMAVGARARDILMQFLIESVVLCLIGGCLGVILGVAASFVMAHYASWPSVVSKGSILVALGFATAIGIFFGFYPAVRASKMDPIESLRHN